MQDSFYIVVRRGRWAYPVVKKATRKSPRLRHGEVAFKVILEIPDSVFSPPKIPLTANLENIIRPVPVQTK